MGITVRTPERRPAPRRARLRRLAESGLSSPTSGHEYAFNDDDGGVALLLHCNRDVCVPGYVNLVTNLKLIEHSRIDDTSAVFPSVRTSEGDRRCALVDIADGRGHRSLLRCRAPRSLSLPCRGGAGRRVDRGLARRLQSRRDGVVIRDRYLVPDLEFIEALRGWGHVDRLELAFRRLNVHDALVMIDSLHGARKGDGLGRECSGLRPAGQRKS